MAPEVDIVRVMGILKFNWKIVGCEIRAELSFA